MALAKRLSEETLDYFREQGRRGGKQSGKARMEKLTPEQRSEVARNAAKARWAAKSVADAQDLQPKKKANVREPRVRRKD
jgi:hypothetical protein